VAYLHVIGMKHDVLNHVFQHRVAHHHRIDFRIGVLDLKKKTQRIGIEEIEVKESATKCYKMCNLTVIKHVIIKLHIHHAAPSTNV
jgi:hypothetical protein